MTPATLYGPEPYPPVVPLALAAILRYPAALELARPLGRELFPPGAARELAAAFVTGEPWPPPGPRVGVRLRDAAELVDVLTHSTVPANEAHALYLVRLLAEVRHGELLADALTWAARAVRERARLSWVRAQVVEAFDAAMGERPLDPAAGWAQPVGEAA